MPPSGPTSNTERAETNEPPPTATEAIHSSPKKRMASRLSRTPVGRERLVITSRDLDILRATDQHRYVRTEHLKQLLFPTTTDRSAQMRLRKLWHHGYLERVYLASVVNGERRPPRGAGVPVFTLAARGRAALHGERSGTESNQETVSPSTIQHELVVTDFMVALQAAIRNRADLWVVETSHAGNLWRKLGGRRLPTIPGGRLVPDGAVTLQRVDRTRETYYLEVVRAGVRAGNATLWDKLLRYSEANHRGAFRELYGHDRVRAVLIATTSEERTEHLRALAKSLPHGRKLFAFASYESKDAEGRTVPRFTAASILDLSWRTVDGEVLKIGVHTPTDSAPQTAA